MGVASAPFVGVLANKSGVLETGGDLVGVPTGPVFVGVLTYTTGVLEDGDVLGLVGVLVGVLVNMTGVSEPGDFEGVAGSDLISFDGVLEGDL